MSSYPLPFAAEPFKMSYAAIPSDDNMTEHMRNNGVGRSAVTVEHMRNGTADQSRELNYLLHRLELLTQRMEGIWESRDKNTTTSHDIDEIIDELTYIRGVFTEEGMAYSIYPLDDILRELNVVTQNLRNGWREGMGDKYIAIAKAMQRLIAEVKEKQRGQTGVKDGMAGKSGGGGPSHAWNTLSHVMHVVNKWEAMFASHDKAAALTDADLKTAHRDIYNAVQYLKTSGLHTQSLATLEEVTTQLQTATAGTMREHDYVHIGHELRLANTEIEHLRASGVVEGDESQKHLVEYANANLASMLQKENVLDLSVRGLYEKFILTWHSIIIEVSDAAVYANAQKEIDGRTPEWWEVMLHMAESYFNIMVKGDRLLYVGIGLVMASFFAYYLDASHA